MILFYVLGITLLSAVVAFKLLYKDSVKAKNRLASQWQLFLKAQSLNDVKGICKFGTQLVYNKHLSLHQLNEMTDVINAYNEEHPELKKLKAALFNKKRHYNRELH
ncbi:hypothetical protein HNV08_14895 [Winogradskyella eckloniae]|uniref:hypothetical protein n=1 Tax=Winogradskyella eckloniae TaxID=1089306 RepID=UPI0015651E85|nr:hypothetical protein [Winogradskyella eckloniae]NRD21343.1 hypothetical protein [Winogradskyella eckloniae]